jgi:hypothetical protein
MDQFDNNQYFIEVLDGKFDEYEADEFKEKPAQW